MHRIDLPTAKTLNNTCGVIEFEHRHRVMFTCYDSNVVDPHNPTLNYTKSKDVDNPAEKLYFKSWISVSSQVQFLLGVSHKLDSPSSFHPIGLITQGKIKHRDLIDSRGSIYVGNDVVIGFQSTILGGVTLGDGCIIGANSVVTKDVKPYEIVGGNPIKHIGWRFNEEDRKWLLENPWWENPYEWIEEHSKIIFGGSIEELKKIVNNK
tara:strand:- start:2933 stop:3556 length:624 start_codon:yes stop_codon:yes gene_type:complete